MCGCVLCGYVWGMFWYAYYSRSFLPPRSSLLAPRSSVLVPRSSFLAPRSSFLAPRSSLLVPRSLLGWYSSPILSSWYKRLLRSSFAQDRTWVCLSVCCDQNINYHISCRRHTGDGRGRHAPSCARPPVTGCVRWLTVRISNSNYIGPVRISNSKRGYVCGAWARSPGSPLPGCCSQAGSHQMNRMGQTKTKRMHDKDGAHPLPLDLDGRAAAPA